MFPCLSVQGEILHHSSSFNSMLPLTLRSKQKEKKSNLSVQARHLLCECHQHAKEAEKQQQQRHPWNSPGMDGGALLPLDQIFSVTYYTLPRSHSEAWERSAVLSSDRPSGGGGAAAAAAEDTPLY